MSTIYVAPGHILYVERDWVLEPWPKLPENLITCMPFNSSRKILILGFLSLTQILCFLLYEYIVNGFYWCCSNIFIC